MLDELEVTQPDCIVVDTMDRFSRNLEDVFDVFKVLRERGINIWPLDWGRESPPDIIRYDSEDYIRARDEVIAAQHERKRIRSRTLRSYEGRRERGATTANRTPIGVVRDGDRLAPGPLADLVADLDDRFLAGMHIRELARFTATQGGWTRPESIRRALTNRAYVTAGVRTPEKQAAIDAEMAARRARFGETKKRSHDHEFTGVFLCPCGRLMFSVFDGEEYLRCGAHPFQVLARLVRPLWLAYLERFTEVAWAERWAAAAEPSDDRRRRLHHQLGEIDQRAAGTRRRRAAAFDLLGDPDPAMHGQARKLLGEIEEDERALEVTRRLLEAEYATLPKAPGRDAGALREALGHLRELYDAAPARWRNGANRRLCAMIGGHPTIARSGKRGGFSYALEWAAAEGRMFHVEPQSRV